MDPSPDGVHSSALEQEPIPEAVQAGDTDLGPISPELVLIDPLLAASGARARGRRAYDVETESRREKSVQAPADTSSDGSPGTRQNLEIISPELVLVDAELARRARASLPWPQPTFPPRQARPAAVPPVRLIEPSVELPAEVRPAEANASLETHQTAQRESPLHFGRRLAAISMLLPLVVALALYGEFAGRSGGLTDTTAPSKSRSIDQPGTDRSQPQAKRRSSRHLPRSTAQEAGRLSLPGDRIEGVVAEIGKSVHAVKVSFGSPAKMNRNGQYCAASWGDQGLTLMFVARRRKNPCSGGRVVGGFATLPRWRTARGLSVGSSLRELRRRYPHAEAVGSGWWMLGTVSRDGSRHRVPLHAHIRSGRVDKVLVN